MRTSVVIEHLTRYSYDREVWIAPQLVRLRPTPYTPAEVTDYQLSISPARHIIHWFEDAFGNHVGRVLFEDKTTELVWQVTLSVHIVAVNPFDFYLEPYASTFPFDYPPELLMALSAYRRLVEPDSSLDALIASPEIQQMLGQSTVGFLSSITRWMAVTIDYTMRLEPGVQTCETTLQRRSGSCRDTAWLLTQLLRHLGLAARFVSGYLVQLANDAPDGPTEDSVDLHAWCAVYLPGAGWVGLDATSGLLTGEGHIPLAAAAAPAAAAPISGSADVAEVTLSHKMHVRRR